MKKNEEILSRVEKYKQKHGISFATPNGRLYKALRWLLLLSLCYWLGYNLLYLAGESLALGDGNTAFADIRDTFLPAAVCTACGIAGLVLIFLKFIKARLIGTILLQPAAAICATTFFRTVRNITYSGVDDRKYLWGIPAFFYWRHLIPAVLVLIFALWMTVLCVVSAVKENKIYRRVEENLYNDRSDEIPSAFGDLIAK